MLAELRALVRAEQQNGDAAEDRQPDHDAQASANSSHYSLYRPEHEPADERRETDDHRERVVIEVTGLQAARDDGQQADGPRAAVDEGAVDQRLVADLPETEAQRSRPRARARSR